MVESVFVHRLAIQHLNPILSHISSSRHPHTIKRNITNTMIKNAMEEAISELLIPLISVNEAKEEED